ncbi:TP53-regulated inhibitor of apoptosis 1-like [Daktulosphaira vitifoliae]|uniref:TP53-regulated inhibitor of apoptosis 1-like n=1 Tax=Daktulosphaira vitifoliae TaxID=58002 RepID=UPI0021A9C9C9|nr:TP53-regulated inhibitor of apoptosis 1-like [Daktulosphaira vitifoliae]
MDVNKNSTKNKEDTSSNLCLRRHLDSFHPDCNQSKQLYDQCFRKWFAEQYMTGQHNNTFNGEHDACQKLFDEYTDCVKKGMKEYGLHYEEIAIFNLETEKEKSKPKKN